MSKETYPEIVLRDWETSDDESGVDVAVVERNDRFVVQVNRHFGFDFDYMAWKVLADSVRESDDSYDHHDTVTVEWYCGESLETAFDLAHTIAEILRPWAGVNSGGYDFGTGQKWMGKWNDPNNPLR